MPKPKTDFENKLLEIVCYSLLFMLAVGIIIGVEYSKLYNYSLGYCNGMGARLGKFDFPSLMYRCERFETTNNFQIQIDAFGNVKE